MNECFGRNRRYWKVNHTEPNAYMFVNYSLVTTPSWTSFSCQQTRLHWRFPQSADFSTHLAFY